MPESVVVTSELASAFADLTETFRELDWDVAFRPGRPVAEVRPLVKLFAAGDAAEQLVEWFTLQDGLTETTSGRLFFDWTPRNLDRVICCWHIYLDIMRELEEDDPTLRELDIWHKPGWFPLEADNDGVFVVETQHPDVPGRVVRSWARDLEEYYESLPAFIRGGTLAMQIGLQPEIVSGRTVWLWPNRPRPG